MLTIVLNQEQGGEKLIPALVSAMMKKPHQHITSTLLMVKLHTSVERKLQAVADICICLAGFLSSMPQTMFVKTVEDKDVFIEIQLTTLSTLIDEKTKED